MPLIPCRTLAGRRRLVALVVTVAAAILSTGCLHHRRRATKIPRRPPPVAQPDGKAAPIIQGEEGIASWYGHPYHGRPTASGEIYNMNAMTAAHRTLPFGTRVRVHDLENGRDVTVRINDRGPFVKGRIIDLSHAAAEAMDMSGTALVRLQILGYGGSAGSAGARRAALPTG